MEQMWAAVIGAVALVGIPVGAWLSRRFTKEGRLLLRIERLGAIHSIVPDSHQRDALGRRVLLLVEELNEWIDVPKAQLRLAQRVLGLIVFVVGLVLSTALTAQLTDPALNVVIQVIGGVVIALAAIGVSTLLERWATKREAAKRSEEETAAVAARYDAIKRGESPGSSRM